MDDNLLIESIGNYMIVKGCASTTSGNRIFLFEDIAEHFQISVEKLTGLLIEIYDYLSECSQIMDQDGIWIEDDAFNLMFYTGYCNLD